MRRSWPTKGCCAMEKKKFHAWVLLAVSFPLTKTYVNAVLHQNHSYLRALLPPRHNLVIPSTSPLHMSCRHLRTDSLTDTTRTTGPSSSSPYQPHTHDGRPRLITSLRGARGITHSGLSVKAPCQKHEQATEYSGKNRNIKIGDKSFEMWQSSNIWDWQNSKFHSWGNLRAGWAEGMAATVRSTIYFLPRFLSEDINIKIHRNIILIVVLCVWKSSLILGAEQGLRLPDVGCRGWLLNYLTTRLQL